jgi:putative hydrolase
MGDMSDLPPGGADFFGRMPLFREFARLMAGSSGPVNWELARQVALATAAGADLLGGPAALPRPATTPDPAERRRWDDHVRLAELWLAPITTLPGPDVAVTARPRSRLDWVEWALGGLPPLIEPAAGRMAGALTAGPEDAGPFGPMVNQIGGLLVGMQVGTVMGQLARVVLGHYDLPVPMGDRGHLDVVPENVAAFERATGLPPEQVELYVATRQLVAQRLVEGVDWYKGHLTSLLEQVAAAIDPDVSGLAGRLSSLDMANPESLQELLAGGDLLGLSSSPQARAALGRLEAFLALTSGYTVTLTRRVLEDRLPALGQIEQALRQAAQGPDGPARLIAALLQADPDKAEGARGERFTAEVLAATDVERLDRVWAHPNFLPTPEELSTAGAWLERMGLVGGEPVDLDKGLRELLGDDGDGSGRPAD